MTRVLKTLLLHMATLLLIGISKCTGISQEEVDYMSEHLAIHYKVNDNVNQAGMKLTLSLKNVGDKRMAQEGWSIYFSHVRVLAPDQLLADGGTYITRQGVQLEHDLKLYHVNGVLFKLEPTENFTPLDRGQEISLSLEAQHWQVARTDVMPNWYVAAENLEAKIIDSTMGESLDFVAPFTDMKQYRRSPLDQWSPFNYTDRYEMFPDEEVSSDVRIIPKPVKSSFDAESMSITENAWEVVYTDATEFSANLLAEKLRMRAVKRTGSASGKFNIDLHVDADVDLDVDVCEGKEEAYKITIDTSSQTVQVVGRKAVGVLHGAQSLIAMAAQMEGTLQKGTITDCPRFGYRGMHVDVGRNFFAKSIILQLLDVMSMYKLNKFHFHLTDDEGWRLEIKDLPELTDIGARRCHDLTGDVCIMPQVGSLPAGGGAGTGYYTEDDYKEILRYAQDRFITVIPEFDMPGHAHAAINAMKARAKATGNDEYLLTDPADTSRYISVQTFIDNAMDPCMTSTYKFVDKVFKTVKSLHEAIQPLTMLNFGGDETAHTAWVNSTECAAMFEGTDFDKKELKKLFAMNVSELAHEMQIPLGGWEDGLMYEGIANEPFNISDMAVDDVYAYTWNNVWEWGAGSRAYRLANAGYKIVLSHATNLYFDHPSEPDPEERGYYWATRWTNSYKTFGYMPDTVYDNIDYDLNGKKITKEEVCADIEKCTPLLKPENIVGIQGQLWTETVRTKQQFEEMIYPRIIALAERAWHKAAWENETDSTKREIERRADWNEWANLVGQHELKRLDEVYISYHLLPPGAKLENNILTLRSEFPGSQISVSTNDGTSWTDVDNEFIVQPGSSVLMRTGSNVLRRYSRHSRVDVPGYMSFGNACAIPASYSILLVALSATFINRLYKL